MDWRGFYVNLNRSADRRAAIEAQLRRLGLEQFYSRIPAAEGNALGFPNPASLTDSVIGCFTSHYLALRGNLDSDIHLHVLEDDVLFAASLPDAVRSLISADLLGPWDVLFTDTLVPPDNVMFRVYKQLCDGNVERDPTGRMHKVVFQFLDLKDMPFAGATSYLVNKRSVRKLHDLYLEELSGGATDPVDLFLRRKVAEGALTASVMVPFVTAMSLEHIIGTTVGLEADRLAVLAGAIANQSFFVECDWALCREFVERYLPVPSGDPHHELLTRLLGFTLTDRFHWI